MNIKNHDYYQIVSYCTALGVDDGILIYPEHEDVIDKIIPIVNSPIRIHQITVDLAKPRAELEGEVKRVAERVWGMATVANGALSAPLFAAVRSGS